MNRKEYIISIFMEIANYKADDYLHFVELTKAEKLDSLGSLNQSIDEKIWRDRDLSFDIKYAIVNEHLTFEDYMFLLGSLSNLHKGAQA